MRVDYHTKAKHIPLSYIADDCQNTPALVSPVILQPRGDFASQGCNLPDFHI